MGTSLWLSVPAGQVPGFSLCNLLLPPLRDFGLTILSKSQTISKKGPNNSATLLGFGKSNNLSEAISDSSEPCLEGKRYTFKNTQRDHLNFELITFKFGLTMSLIL